MIWYFIVFFLGLLFGIVAIGLLASAGQTNQCQSCLLFEQFKEKQKQAMKDYLIRISTGRGYPGMCVKD